MCKPSADWLSELYFFTLKQMSELCVTVGLTEFLPEFLQTRPL